MNKEGRIYGLKVNVEKEKIRDFFDKRAIDFSLKKKTRNTTVLLGDGNSTYADNWDEYEKKVILPYLKIKKSDVVLDIGCGIGRWAESVIPLCDDYIGTDISSEMIKAATDIYSCKYKNASFINVSFQDVFDRAEIQKRKFDKIIITGVSMYLNGTDLSSCYVKLKNFLTQDGVLYMEESIGVKERLTLNNIWSENLKSNYWAIYRTEQEYLALLRPLLDCSEILKSGFFYNLDKKEMQDTGHWHIILRKNGQ